MSDAYAGLPGERVVAEGREDVIRYLVDRRCLSLL